MFSICDICVSSLPFADCTILSRREILPFSQKYLDLFATFKTEIINRHTYFDFFGVCRTLVSRSEVQRVSRMFFIFMVRAFCS